MTFRERFMAGEADFEEIFDLTSKWNFSDEICTLREYLGLTVQEEDVWISVSDEALEELMEKEKRTKIFFTDLDDTLLNEKKEITVGNRKAIEELLAAGHFVVISTGRALPGARYQAERLGLIGKNCYIICFNGGQIYDTEHDKLIYRQSLPMEYLRPLFDAAHEFGINIQTYSDTHVLAERDSEDLQYYCELQHIQPLIVPDITQALDEAPAKVLALDFQHPERVNQFRDHLAQMCQGKMDLFLSHPSLLEVVPPQVNKGNAIRYLCDYLGIPLANSVSAGDAENDLTMIQAAGIGAAMCNGISLVKEAADYVTKADQNHDGVAEIIYKFIL